MVSLRCTLLAALPHSLASRHMARKTTATAMPKKQITTIEAILNIDLMRRDIWMLARSQVLSLHKLPNFLKKTFPWKRLFTRTAYSPRLRGALEAPQTPGRWGGKGGDLASCICLFASSRYAVTGNQRRSGWNENRQIERIYAIAWQQVWKRMWASKDLSFVFLMATRSFTTGFMRSVLSPFRLLSRPLWPVIEQGKWRGSRFTSQRRRTLTITGSITVRGGLWCWKEEVPEISHFFLDT